MSIKIVIIDDEQPARELVKNFLNPFENTEILAECPDGFSGLKAINELKPDIVFLDIQMPKLTGFEMLELLENPPVIIFTTAYDQFAIKAFEMNATDYLLKPFTRERLSQALGKAIHKLKEKDKVTSESQGLKTILDEKPELLHRIAVKTGQKIQVVPVDEVLYIGAEGDYVMIYTKESRYLKEKTMKYMESHLDPTQFIRIHRASIVNVNYIARVELYEKESYAVILKNGQSLKASSSGYKLLKQELKL